MRFFYIAIILFIACSQVLAKETKDSTKNYKIEDIVVKSYRLDMMLKNVPGKVEVIGAAQIARTPSLSVADIIKKNTTCETVDLQGLNSGVDFRGFAPGSMGVNRFSAMLIDGMPMGTMNAATTMTTGISSIEVLKGPFSALYGSGAMGGVVNIISMNSRGKIGGSAVVGYGSFNTAQGSVSLGGNLTRKLDFDLSVEYVNQKDNYKTGDHNFLRLTPYEKIVLDDASFGKRYENSSFDKNGAVLRVGYDISDKWRVNIYNNIYYTSNAASNGSFWGDSGQTDKGIFRNYHRIDLTYKDRAHDVRFSPYFSRESVESDFKSTWENSTEKKSYRTYGFQLQDVITLPFMRLIVGVDNFSQRNKSSRKINAQTETYPWNPDYMDMQTGVFAQANISLLDDRLSSIVGVRYDNTLFRTFKTPNLDLESSTKFYNSVNPTFALKYQMSRLLNVHGSLGRAFLVPEAYKTVGEYHTYAIFKGNKDLKPETAFTVDLGAGLNSRDGALQADVTWFSTRHKNLIGNLTVQEPDYEHNTPGIYTFSNAQKASMQGVEAMLTIDFGRMFAKKYSLKIFGNYTYIYKSEVTHDQLLSERLYVSGQNATFGAEYVGSKFSVRVAGRYVGDKLNDNFYGYLTTPEGTPFRDPIKGDKLIGLPDFMTFDIFVDYRILRSVSLGVKCANLLDENYMERDGYYMPGRNFSAQLSLRF